MISILDVLQLKPNKHDPDLVQATYKLCRQNITVNMPKTYGVNNAENILKKIEKNLPSIKQSLTSFIKKEGGSWGKPLNLKELNPYSINIDNKGVAEVWFKDSGSFHGHDIYCDLDKTYSKAINYNLAG